MTTTSDTTYVDQDYLYAPNAGDFGVSYRVRAHASDGLYSDYSLTAYVQAEERNKAFPADAGLPSFALESNYPNPFNPSTTISFTIESTSLVRLTILDILGRQVALLVNGTLQRGTHSARWDATGMPSGVYLCRLQGGNHVQVQKMLLQK